MSEAKIWEEKLIIPTYEVGDPDKNPMFLEKRVYQGSSGKIYPYPATQTISREKTDHEYKAVWLENKYIKVMILPELGGRIQRAYDKTNGYDFIYYNHVIKPALVGLLGPWISGGIEFNWPQHHRPTTFMPVNYRIKENEDGSVTLETGDVDRMYGTREITRFTLYPERAYIEIEGQLFNATPLPQTFLWWANPAVSVNDNTQSIFPPDVKNVYDHGKRDVSRFPIATGVYYKHDYSAGVDISRYKNIPVPTSYMAEKSDYDFVGGYDYGVDAGLLHVADHHISPGKKQWTWGCGDFGQAWDRNLTDEDGPYIELMTGMFCDNQPDFSWLKPYEEKKFKQYFMPYKKVGRVKNASTKAVLGVERVNGGLSVKVYGTEPFENVELTIYSEGKNLYREEISISPENIYEKTVSLNLPAESEVRVSVRKGADELVSFLDKPEEEATLAEPAKPVKAPEDIKTNEELFLSGQHIEQYRHATFLPDPYYLEGLKRDEGDIRINNAYGSLLLRRGRFKDAEKYFRTAIKRLTLMHPNPYDSEPIYNLGLALFYQERYKESFDAFYKATWSNEQQEMSFYFLAAIKTREALKTGSEDALSEALYLIEKALIKNAHNTKARALKALILYKQGKTEGALKQVEENLIEDPFDFISELLRGEMSESEYEKDINTDISENAHTTLRLSRDYAEWGFYDEAIALIDACKEPNPMLYYYKGFYQYKLSKTDAYKEALLKAEKENPTYCFPNTLEDIQVLNFAISGNPQGSRAYYYLGNLYYDKLRYEEAISLWEKSIKLDGNYPTVLRNLSIAYYNKKGDKDKALECLEKAFSLDKKDARVFLELDQLLKMLGRLPEERLSKYKENISLIEDRDDLYTEYVTVLNLTGRHEEAIKAIRSHVFRTWEGAEGKISTQFKTSLLELARKELKVKNAKKAEEYLREALSYPHNLGEGRLEGTKDNHLYYHLGLALEMQGKEEEAKKCYELATLGASEVAGMLYYYDQPADMLLYQGLSYKKLSDEKKARAKFDMLLEYGETHMGDTFKQDYFAVSMPDFAIFDEDMTKKNRLHCLYVSGLGRLGLGDTKKALKDFDEVLKEDKCHQNALLYKNECDSIKIL